MANNQFAMRARPEQILADDCSVVWHASEALGTIVIAELVVGETDIEQIVEQFAGCY